MEVQILHGPLMKKTKTTPLINVVTKLGVADAIDLCISEIGARRVLKTIFAICFRNTLEKSCFPMNLLANNNSDKIEQHTRPIREICWYSGPSKPLNF
jgi:hypothetical protein